MFKQYYTMPEFKENANAKFKAVLNVVGDNTNNGENANHAFELRKSFVFTEISSLVWLHRPPDNR